MTKFSIESVLDITKTEIYMTNHQFDVDTRAINCLNGELHFKEGAWHLEPHDKQNYRTTQIPIVYNPEASAPRFEQFLDEVFEDDKDAEEKKIIVCELLGYSLLTSCEFEKFAILVGNGANGKSVLLHIVEQLVGTANVSAVQPSQFDNRFQRAHLFGKLVNIVTEIAEGAEIADAPLKQLFLESEQLLNKSIKILLISILFAPVGLEQITCLIVVIFPMLFFEEPSFSLLIENLKEPEEMFI